MDRSIDFASSILTNVLLLIYLISSQEKEVSKLFMAHEDGNAELFELYTRVFIPCGHYLTFTTVLLKVGIPAKVGIVCRIKQTSMKR